MPGKEYNGRTVQVIFPSPHFFTKWHDKAKASKMPLSKWIFETVEGTFDITIKPDPSLARDQADLKDENRMLRRELSDKAMQIERLETENFKFRHEAFLQPIEGSAQLSEMIVKMLRSGGTWSNQALVKELGITVDDIKALNILVGQLQVLQDFGLVRESVKGWTWID